MTVVAPGYHTDQASLDKAAPFAVERFAAGLHSTSGFPRVLRRVLAIDPARYDIIHAAEWSFAVACGAVARFKRLPFIATLHGTDVYAYRTSRVARLIGASRALHRAHAVSVSSHYLRATAQAFHPDLPESHFRIAPLGVGAQWFEPPSSPSIAAAYGIDAGRRIILTAARLTTTKGHRQLLRALAALPDAAKDQLVYVAAGHHDNALVSAELRLEAARTGVPFLFTGPLSPTDLHRLCAEAWLHAMTPVPNSRGTSEGFDLVYLEAAAQGLPSLASATGGIPEVVVDGSTGILVPPNDTAAITAALTGLLQNPSRVEALGKAAREHARAFTWERCARLTYAIP